MPSSTMATRPLVPPEFGSAGQVVGLAPPKHWAAISLNLSMPLSPPRIFSATTHWPFCWSSADAVRTMRPVAWAGHIT